MEKPVTQTAQKTSWSELRVWGGGGGSFCWAVSFCPHLASIANQIPVIF